MIFFCWRHLVGVTMQQYSLEMFQATGADIPYTSSSPSLFMRQMLGYYMYTYINKRLKKISQMKLP